MTVGMPLILLAIDLVIGEPSALVATAPSTLTCDAPCRLYAVTVSPVVGLSPTATAKPNTFGLAFFGDITHHTATLLIFPHFVVVAELPHFHRTDDPKSGRSSIYIMNMRIG